MSQLSKQQLKVENNTEFPNNNSGQITPTRLRTFNEDMIDSTVNQTSFDSFSGSVASQFAAATGSVTSAITASSLITASFASQTLTFTKGDGSTFGIVIPDVSGSTINTGSFATTGSNTFYGDQIISGNILPTTSTGGDIGSDTFKWNKIVVQGELKGSSLNTTGRASVGTIRMNDESFPLSFLSDREIVADGTGANTHIYYGTSSVDVNGLREFVYVQSGSNADFTAASASFNTRINNITTQTGSFATTGSNTFNGNQIINGTGGDALFLRGYVSMRPISGQQYSYLQLQGNEVGNTSVGISFDKGAGFVFRNDGNNFSLYRDNDTNTIFSIGVADVSASFVLNKNFVLSGSANIQNTLTASLQQGYAWVGDANGRTTTVATSSFGGGQTFSNPSIETISGSVLITANTFNSGAANLTHLSASAQNQANLVFKYNNNTGTTQISGSGNIFTNPSSPGAGRVNYIGSTSNLFLNGQNQQLPNITASAASVSGNRPTMHANYVAGTHQWIINQANNPGLHTYNNNVTIGTGIWTWNMQGNTGAVTISNNIGANSTMTLNAPSASLAGVAAGVSGSSPLTLLNNLSLGTILNYNGPISSSGTLSISNNSMVGGTNTFGLQSGSRGATIQNNSFIGSSNIIDNVASTTLSSSPSITNNLLNGTTITNRFSASFTVANNNINGFTITNDYDASTNGTTGRTAVLQGNQLFGFVGSNIYFSGSANGTGTTNDRGRGLYGNLIGGSRISASVIGDGNRHLIASAIVGHGLNIYGTSPYDASNAANAGGQNGGSAFFGRWNAEDGNRALSSQTVFVVGTGVSGSTGITRKTGFLIDSGSNTFIEGTLNVSGSSTLSGSLYIQSGSTLPVSTGSAILTWDATTGQVKQAGFSTIVSASVSSAEFWSTITESGSAGVSGSITFNNSGSAYNVSLVNGTQLTVANAGVYNIQFSAQIETSAGADTMYMWFKKNGTNIGDSASKAVLANNTAQVLTVNILDQAVANDYYEIAYQTLNGNATVLAEAASGNIPAIPSVIATVFQIR